MQIVFPFVAAIVTMVILDVTWLTLMLGRFYDPNIGHLLADKANFIPAIFFYLVYAAGVTGLIVLPAMAHGWSTSRVAMLGVLLGVMAYGTYDFTNHATLKDWPMIVTVVDVVWGAVITAVVALVAFGVAKYFN